MCPQCGGRVHVLPFDFGICPETGYHDAGEGFRCVECGATGDADDLAAPFPAATRTLPPRRERAGDAPKRLKASEETKTDMATQPNRTPREVVDFPLNTPVTVALKYGQGKTVSSQYGERMMYSLVDGRVMFLDLEAASQIEHLAINVRESFTITRRPAGPRGEADIWEVARFAGEQPNETFVVPALDPPTPKPPASAATCEAPRKQSGSALVDEANALVDSFALVLERSLTLYQGRIKPDEVKSLFVTAYIQRRQFSSVA
jgi:hypothetical protein